MADFAPNFTARYRYSYSSLGKTHTQGWRLVNTVTDPAPIASKIGLWLADLQANLWTDFTVLHAEFALADSDVFLPCVAPDSPTGGTTIVSGAPAHAADALSFVCRSAAGGKGRVFLYGTAYGLAESSGQLNDWRFMSSEDSAISAAIVRLNETAPALVCNDNHTAVWYEYANFKPNDKWVRKLRRG